MWTITTNTGRETKSSSQPFLSRINSKYDLVIQGPLVPILNASSPTVYAKEENQGKP